MRGICILLLAVFVLILPGCTEMRIEGDAKVFQSSAVGTVIQTLIGLGLIVLGILAFVGSILPDKKPKNRLAKPSERLTTGQRIGLAVFWRSDGVCWFVSLCNIAPVPQQASRDRLSRPCRDGISYSQTGGREVVVPFANLASVELRDEPNIVGKLRTVFVLTEKGGREIKQDAGNNERQAIETIQQALADYQKTAPAMESRANAAAMNAPAGGNNSGKSTPLSFDAVT